MMPLLLQQHNSLHLVLQADLAAKYLVIFQNYGLDLEEVQKLYEKHKHAPPVVRNAPPVAGNIMWARQLLRRIEMPMKRSALLSILCVLCLEPCWSSSLHVQFMRRLTQNSVISTQLAVVTGHYSHPLYTLAGCKAVT